MWPFINNYDEVTKERLKLSEDVLNGDFYSSLVHKKNTYFSWIRHCLSIKRWELCFIVFIYFNISYFFTGISLIQNTQKIT